MNKKYTREILEKVVKESLSYRQVLSKLNLREAGGNYSNIKVRIEQFGISTAHFKRTPAKTLTTTKVENRLIENSTYSTGLPYSSYKLKNLLFNNNIKERRCECCGNVSWLNKPIALELHHINGNKFDNRIGNLQILCPNCHAFTDNYRAKNIKAPVV